MKLGITESIAVYIFSFICIISLSIIVFPEVQVHASEQSPETSTLKIQRYLQAGMSGQDVALLQQALEFDPNINFQPAVIGQFGLRTTKAVKFFQYEHGLPLTGNVGPKTLVYINNLLTYGTSTDIRHTDARNLVAAFDNATSSLSLSVLIEFNSLPGEKEAELVRSYQGVISYSYHLIPCIAAKIPKENLFKLFNDPNVKTVEIDHELKRIPSSFEDVPNTNIVSTSTETIPTLQNQPLSIAIIDTGIDYTHKDLNPYYAGGYNFVNHGNDPMDDNGHGTTIAGVILKTIKNFDPQGIVAPRIKLYALKALNAHGTGYYSNIIAALEWAVDQHIVIVNNSYATQMNPGKIFEEAFNTASTRGTLSIASAGNSGSCDTTDTTNTIEYPAKYSSVVAITAVDNRNQHPCFSSAGPEAEIAAPGVAISSTSKGGGYIYASGTSVATAYVSGAAALLLGNNITDANNNGAVNDDIRAVLDKSSDSIKSAQRDNIYGFGVINITKALSLIRSH